MVKTTEVVYKYVEGEFAVKHKKDGFKANSTRVLIGYANLSIALFYNIKHDRFSQYLLKYIIERFKAINL